MDISARALAQTETVLLALTRHQQRRAQGIPTLSVMIGPREAAETVWNEWAASTAQAPARIVFWSEQEIMAGDSQVSPELVEDAFLYVDPSPESDVEERRGRLSRAVEWLSRRLTLTEPGSETACAISVLPADATAYLRDEAHTRTRAMFIEGIIMLPDHLCAATPDVGAHALLTRLGASPATAAQFRAAEAVSGEANDRARSEAERFLFDLLGDLPDTAGLFELNVRLGFCFGPMPAEVDLLAASLQLAVEIDGFHHFRDPENYRRDRRKDALLQKQGYLVLRFLAGDVVTRLEDIIEEIRAAVAFRRATRR